MDCFELNIELEFCAAHILVGHKGKCANLHGHNYRVEFCVSGEHLDSLRMLIDFADLKKEVTAVINNLDHKYLVSIPRHFQPCQNNRKDSHLLFGCQLLLGHLCLGLDCKLLL